MMNRSWKDQRDNIYKLIKQISDVYGGDDSEWLNGYAKDVIAEHKDDLNVAEQCLIELWNQVKI